MAVDELAKDAGQWATLPDTAAARNASLALVWLDSVFLGLSGTPGSDTLEDVSGGTCMRKACAHVPVDASVTLQVSTTWICSLFSSIALSDL